MESNKKDTNELTYEADSQISRSNLELPKGQGGGGGVNEECGVNRNTATYKLGHQQGPAVWHRPSTQCPTTPCMGREPQREWPQVSS